MSLDWKQEPGDAAGWAADGRAWSYLVNVGPSGVILTRWRTRTPDGDLLREALGNAFLVLPPRGIYDTSPGLVERARHLADLWEAGESGSPMLGRVHQHPAWGPEVQR